MDFDYHIVDFVGRPVSQGLLFTDAFFLVAKKKFFLFFVRINVGYFAKLAEVLLDLLHVNIIRTAFDKEGKVAPGHHARALAQQVHLGAQQGSFK